MVNERPNVSPAGLYSKAEVAVLLGISRRTVDRYAASGLIKFRPSRVNGRPRTTGHQILKAFDTL